MEIIAVAADEDAVHRVAPTDEVQRLEGGFVIVGVEGPFEGARQHHRGGCQHTAARTPVKVARIKHRDAITGERGIAGEDIRLVLERALQRRLHAGGHRAAALDVIHEGEIKRMSQVVYHIVAAVTGCVGAERRAVQRRTAILVQKHFRIGRLQVLYVIPYIIPLVIASLLFYGVFRGTPLSGSLLLIFPALGMVSFVVVLFWGAAQDRMPVWLGISFCASMGSLTLWVCMHAGAEWALTFAESGNLLMTALLLAFVFPRFSPGAVLSVIGFVAWSLTALQIIPAIGLNPSININLIHVIVMGKVVAALGMIMLTLEDELDLNRVDRERERRARRELEAYTNLMLARRRVEDFDRQGSDICRVVMTHSRFAQAALLLENAGRYGLAGSAGLDEATVAALGKLAARIPAADFLAPGSAPSAVEHSQTLNLDLTPWLKPGDDLKRLRFTRALAVPMTGRAITEGALLLAGMRPTQGSSKGLQQDPLRADDLLPIEMLTARLQATRSQTMTFEKLIDSEKLAGLGQLASNVTHHLNNPLTVVLGYASLLEETVALDAPER